jgi:[protein-PII] uridylyltransferase
VTVPGEREAARVGSPPDWGKSNPTQISSGDGAEMVRLCKEALARCATRLRLDFEAGAEVAELVAQRSSTLDRLLLGAWRALAGDRKADAALVAVGGYGRSELFPGSDIDVMILYPGADRAPFREGAERFVAFLWDVGLDVGHSFRSLDDCAREAQADLSVVTNLMESRLLCGNEALFHDMRIATGPERIWPADAFFRAKRDEQRARYARFDDAAYNLEPNIKEAPGGLRDIQTIAWVAQRYFGAAKLHELVGRGCCSEEEYQTLVEGQAYLWRIRFALHTLTGSGEDRLLFDYQRALAGQFGFRDQDHVLGVEQFMQRYYRTVMEVQRLGEMLLQLFEESILYHDEPAKVAPINRYFQARNGFIEVTRDDMFRRYPFALLEIFLVLQEHTELSGVRASTIRLMRDHRHLINENFRNDIRARSLFMEILRQPRGLTHELRRMHRHGILAAYLPVFAKIVGKMQYDLFHVYTVDEHTLFMVRNLRRFAVPELAGEFPLCSAIFGTLPKPELLYIAGLFHDIAKGRGGDHSDLGASDAEEFCARHDLSRFDARLVAWLVRNHLLLSITAQRQDISDPEVVHDFATQIGSPTRLDYLYLLTVADIRATNPKLWNSWKDALLQELYFAAKRALRRGLERPIDQEELIADTQEEARTLLRTAGLDLATVERIWAGFGPDYFLRHSGDEIYWHTSALSRVRSADLPIVLIRSHGQRGGTEVFLYTRDHDNLFAITSSVLDQLGLTIVDARIITSVDGHSLDTYVVLEGSGESISGAQREQEIVDALRRALAESKRVPRSVTRRTPRSFKHFPITTAVSFSEDRRNARTVLELFTADRPGVLSKVGQAFAQCGIRVQNARIATIGSRAEDVFFITDRNNQPLASPKQSRCLRTAILDHLERNRQES